MALLTVLLLVLVLVVLAGRPRGRLVMLRVQGWIRRFFGLLFFAITSIASATGLAVLSPVLVLVLIPSFLLRLLVVPLGSPRLVYWLAKYCSLPRLGVEADAGAVIYGALALARRTPDPEAVAWLEKRAKDAGSLRGVGVIAAGLLAALRGNRHRARCLLRLADTLPRKLVATSARAIARDWLVADAARIGNWPEIIRLGRRGWDSLRWSYAIARMAERLVGDAKGGRDWLLWLCWMVAPRRRSTFSLLRRALAVPRAPVQTGAAWSAIGSLAEALVALADGIESRFMQGRGWLDHSLSGVDAALDCLATRTLVEQRLCALEAQPAPEAVLSGFRSRMVDLVAPLIEESPSLAGRMVHSPILDQAIRQVRSRLFADIAVRCQDYEARRERKSSLRALTEWEVWAVTRECADRLIELDPEAENQLFQSMGVPVFNFARFQQEHVSERRLLAHDMYSWLHRHGGSDPEARRILLENMQASES